MDTYRNHGLPPTPISSVSITSLHAALHPASGDTLFFVAKKDGSHAFAKTYLKRLISGLEMGFLVVYFCLDFSI
jgi:cell division protein YceG involved in septum cleavage